MSFVLCDPPVLSPPVPAGPAWTERLQLLLESTGDGIFGVDLAGRCTFVNRAAAEMLGHRTEAVLGRNMHELIHHTHADGRHYPEADCPIFNAFRRGLPCRIDSEVLWRAAAEGVEDGAVGLGVVPAVRMGVVDQLVHVAAQHRFGAMSQHFRGGAVHEGAAAGEVDAEDAVAGGFQ